MLPRKTSRRIRIVNHIMDILQSPSLYRQIGAGHNENQIKNFIYKPFQLEIVKLYMKDVPSLSEKSALRKAEASLLWEGDQDSTINNILLFGVQHRPDFVINMPDFRLAVEIKRG